jgi:large subunit ribosomal protein L1
MVKKRSKRFQLAKKIVSEKQIYSLDEGLSYLKNISTVKFDETLETHFHLNVDPKYGNQQLRTTVELPFGTGKKLKIAVLTDSEKIEDIKKLGVFRVGEDDLIQDIQQSKIDFDLLITSRKYIGKLTPLGKILGPRGLMPSSKFGTVTENLELAIEEFQKGKIEYRVDRSGIVHVGIGKISFLKENLKENILSLYRSIEKNRPLGVRGRYLKSLYICLTMSPSICINLQSLK